MNPDFSQLVVDFMGRTLFSIGTSVITVGGLTSAVVFVVVLWWVASLMERMVQRIVARRAATEPWKYAGMLMLSRLLRYVVWAVGTLIGLEYLGIDLSSIALLGSALAVGLGFGLQHVVSNFVSGVIILLERSLKVGDFVELESGVRGHVSEIAMRYTRITSNDALDVVVPNSEFINGRVVNWTLGDAYRRMHIPFGVAYGTPKEMVREAGIAAAKRIPGVMETDKKKSTVWLVAYGDNAMNYELVVWADRILTTRPGSAHADLMWALDDELHQRGIAIPFPQRDLHIRSGTLDVRVAASEGRSPWPSTAASTKERDRLQD
ncbi:mechanosensitive ion channel domain-containing protein [Hydrogenophaga sp. PAMC20947]|uniref:mechanosensitive ion channel family protein n=1 Tax=Hydrogenophaga sp. PAMC20947 TaxID=2565558 RepID=UPI00109E0519|nr:mechanosensitive ion channel domain-containing protein [Hydrogenophaga sp. PAMC20947]QCB47731.1 mechanosensitive ion channel [Hydrogenophaga sp. PAMC20947]